MPNKYTVSHTVSHNVSRNNNNINTFEIKNISELEILSKQSTWQNFEKITAWLFEQNDYTAQQNVIVAFNKKRRQYDVVAKKNNLTILVDCKKWGAGRQRTAKIKKAVEQHIERCEFYKTTKNTRNVLPLIITIIDDGLEIYNNISIVPVIKLNQFLNELQ